MDQDQTKKLVTLAVQGDKEAFTILYRFWVGKIYAYTVVRVGIRQEAEDLTEKVFIKVLKSIRSFKQQSSFATWIYAITRNELTDFYRKKRIQPLIIEDIDSISEQEIEAFDQQKHHQNVEMIKSLLSKLPEDYQQVLKLRFIQNLSIKDTSAVLGISQGNVKVRQLRAINKARELSA